MFKLLFIAKFGAANLLLVCNSNKYKDVTYEDLPYTAGKIQLHHKLIICL